MDKILYLKTVFKNGPVYKCIFESVVTLGRIAELFLRRYFVCFCFGKILFMGHKGFVDRDLWSFLSAFSKSSRISILIEVYFLLKHLSRKCCIVVGSESVAPYMDRP